MLLPQTFALIALSSPMKLIVKVAEKLGWKAYQLAYCLNFPLYLFKEKKSYLFICGETVNITHLKITRTQATERVISAYEVMIKAIICAKFLTYGYVDLGDCGTLGGGGGAWKGGLDAANRPVPPCINLLVIMKTTPTEIILEINDHTHMYSQTRGGRTVRKQRRQKSSSSLTCIY